MNRKRKRREESKRLPNKNMQDGMSGSRPETDYYLTESVFIIPSSINLGLCPPLHIFLPLALEQYFQHPICQPLQQETSSN